MTKPRRLMNDSEATAKLVLEEVSPGAKLEYHREQSHGEYDFDLHHASGIVGAVEVTQSADQLLRWANARIRSKKDGGSIIDAKHCNKSWIVSPMKDAETIPLIKKKVDQ